MTNKLTKLLATVALAASLTACDKSEITPSSPVNQGAHNIPTRIERDNNLPLLAGKALEKATVVTLYSMDSSAQWDSTKRGLQVYKTISKTTLTKDKAKLATSAVQEAISHGDKMANNCVFSPNYALSTKTGGHNYEYLLSYECNQALVYDNGQDIAWLNINGKPDVFNMLMKDAKVTKKVVKIKTKVKAKAKK